MKHYSYSKSGASLSDNCKKLQFMILPSFFLHLNLCSLSSPFLTKANNNEKTITIAFSFVFVIVAFLHNSNNRNNNKSFSVVFVIIAFLHLFRFPIPNI